MADPRPTISTHVLDLELGIPAVGVPVALFRLEDYQLVFDLAAYAATLDRDADFFENLALGIRIDDTERSYHVPLLLSPFGISTYRGT